MREGGPGGPPFVFPGALARWNRCGLPARSRTAHR